MQRFRGGFQSVGRGCGSWDSVLRAEVQQCCVQVVTAAVVCSKRRRQQQQQQQQPPLGSCLRGFWRRMVGSQVLWAVV